MKNDHATILQTRDLERTYTMEGETVHAVAGVTLDIPTQKMTAIVGRSGSGKTTLLNLLSGLDKPTAGEVWFEGMRLDNLPEATLLALRRDRMGFVFQNFGLLPLLSAEENVGVPLRMRRLPRKEREERVGQALEWVGLGHRRRHRPYELSGGEQQRVAIARALAVNPRLILADEPTGQLDSQRGAQIIDLLRLLVTERGITLVMVTHDPQVMEAADLQYEMRDGKLVHS